MDEQPFYGIKKEPVKVLGFDHYRTLTTSFNKYADKNKLMCLCFGILEESGELMGKFKKAIRDNGCEFDEARRLDVIKEIGDVLWYLSELANYRKMVFSTIGNIEINNRHIFENVLALRKPINYLVDSALKTNVYVDFIHYENVYHEICQICYQFGVHIDHVLQVNIDKLTDRYNRNMIGGSGDNR